MARAAWFHCFAGTAGDMTLGALVDAGADRVAVMEMVGGVPVDGYALTFDRVLRGGVAATHAVVVTHDEHGHEHGHEAHPHRPYRVIRDMLHAADLPARVRDRALRTFAVLAEVEGRIHGVDADEVEFHEVGGVDAIVDIVGVCAALEVLGVDRISCGPIAVGTGRVSTAHGVLPNPVPAVAALLATRQVPTRGLDDGRELATPTGVALMVALADGFGPLPAMRVEAVGYGAGTREVEGRPNVVQVVLGEVADRGAEGAPDAADGQPVLLLECNVDDVTGEVIAHAIARLLDAGAHDAWATPIVMKKGRPAHTVHALVDPAQAAAVREVMVAETGTLGVRGHVWERWPQSRDESVVLLDGQAIRVKRSAQRVKVEHDDAAAAAAALGLPLRTVLERAASLAADAEDPANRP